MTTGLRRFLRRAFQQREKLWRRPLFVTHATRDDLLLGFLNHHQKMMTQQGGRVTDAEDWAGAMVLSVGASAQFPDLDADVAEDDAIAERIPFSYLTQMAVDLDAPVLVTSLGTLDALDRMKTFTAKHNINDTRRVKAAIAHYEPQIDFDALLRD